MNLESKIKLLFNDKLTSDLIICVDKKCFYVHRCILQLYSKYFHDEFLSTTSTTSLITRKSSTSPLELIVDYTCSSNNCIKVWYDFDKNVHNGKQNELYYDHEIFGRFLEYLLDIESKTVDEMIVLGYLAKKFDVPDLSESIDGLLELMPLSWTKKENKWKASLQISNWLGFERLRVYILKFLVKMIDKVDNYKEIDDLFKQLDEQDQSWRIDDCDAI
nr:11276_t:CDS:2 [Entrophospora candida]